MVIDLCYRHVHTDVSYDFRFSSLDELINKHVMNAMKVWTLPYACDLKSNSEGNANAQNMQMQMRDTGNHGSFSQYSVVFLLINTNKIHNRTVLKVTGDNTCFNLRSKNLNNSSNFSHPFNKNTLMRGSELTSTLQSPLYWLV